MHFDFNIHFFPLYFGIDPASKGNIIIHPYVINRHWFHIALLFHKIRNTTHILHHIMPFKMPIVFTFSVYVKASHSFLGLFSSTLTSLSIYWPCGLYQSISEFSHIGNTAPIRCLYEVIFTDIMIEKKKVLELIQHVRNVLLSKTWNVGISTQNVREQRLKHCWGCFGFDTSMFGEAKLCDFC